jgi:hypothetical protein
LSVLGPSALPEAKLTQVKNCDITSHERDWRGLNSYNFV